MAIVVQGAWADDDYFIGSNEYAPYKVGSAEDLIELSTRMKRHKDAYYVMCYVVLTNDIDMSAYPDWTPIGYDEDAANRMGFNGTFDGMGHSIYNLKSQSGNVGLFWKLWGADIRNVNFRNVDLKGAKGSVVCTETVDATIENVNVMSGSISINQSASGICVKADMIKRCENHANVTSPNTAAGISVNAQQVVECINYGDVTGDIAAGISYSYYNNDNIVSDCANYGTISGRSPAGISALVEGGKLVNCLNAGAIVGTEETEAECGGLLATTSGSNIQLLGNNMYVAPNGSTISNVVGDMGLLFNPVTDGKALKISNTEISNGFAAYYLQKYHQDNDEVPVWVWGQNLAKEGSHPILVKGNPNLDNPRVFGHVTMRCDKTVTGEFSNEVSFGDSFQQMVNHSPEFVEMDHDCEIGGTQEHWVCQVCHKIFKDEECTEETSLDELTIPAGHDFADGVCKYCGYDISIAEGNYTISVAATGKDFDYEKIECFDYIRYFVPNRNGILQISLTGGGDVDKVVEIFKKTGDSYPYVNVRIDNPIYLTANVEEGVAYYIGIRASENNVAINDASLSLKLICSEHKIEYVAEKEPTCTEHGHGQFLYCSACGKYFDYYTGYETDWKSYDWGLAEHKLVDGVCQVCDYEVPTLKLAEDADGNFTYSADNVEFDRKGVYWGESHSIFRVFIPEHGMLDVKAYVDVTSGDYQPVKVKSAHEFEYHESYPSGGGVQSAPQRRKAPEVYIPEQNTQVPGGGYVYILVNNEEKVTSKLEVTLYSHKDNVHEIEAKPATCTADGVKSHFYCDHEDCTFKILVGREWETTYYYFTEDGIGNPGDEELIIPATGHQFDEDGQCSVCGMKEAILADGENNVIFPRGIEQTTVFKYTATHTKRLNVTVETDAYIKGQVIIPWSAWEKMQGGGDNDDRPASVRRRVGARNIEPLMAQNVVEGNVYAIAFLTDADDETPAVITLSYSDYPVVTVGENTINIAAVNDESDTEPDCYNLFKFVAPATGMAHIYTRGEGDTYGQLFDINMSSIKDCKDDIDNSVNNYNFNIDYEVVKGTTYYVGVREYDGEPIDEYSLVIKYEGIPDFEGTLALDDTKSLEENLGEWIDLEMFTATRGVTYNRNATTSKWGTVVLPYELQSNDKIAYYELTKADIQGGNLEFTKVETVAPNTPTVYRIINGNQYDASVEDPVTIEVPEKFGNFDLYVKTKVESWFLDGWYYEDVIDTQHDDYFMDSEGHLDPDAAGIMYISKDQFWHATGSIKVKPYRAIFEAYDVNWSAPSVKAMTITFDDENGEATTIHSIMDEEGDFTDIETIYDLNGRKQSKLGQGVNIIRTADGKTRKIIQK